MIIMAVRDPLLSTPFLGPDQNILHPLAPLKPASTFQTEGSQGAPSGFRRRTSPKVEKKRLRSGHFSSALALLQHWQSE
jgi:hypothetical protein